MKPKQTLHERFQSIARRWPHKTAVSSLEGQRLTYAELDAKSNQVAHLLRQRGVRPDTLVGLCLGPELGLIIGLLGICKAGGAYVPIDPRSRSKRMNLIFDDSSVDLVVTESDMARMLPLDRSRIVCLDDEQTGYDTWSGKALGSTSTQDNLAYAIYTSGSSGAPKGVLIEHGSVVRLFDETRQWFSFGPDDIWTLFHSPGFDFSVWEIWGALLHGGELVLVPPAVTRSPSEFIDVLRRAQVTVLNQTPSAFRQLIHADRHGADDLRLRLIIFGGEPLDVASLQPWIAKHGDDRPRLVNMYGITETTVHVTCRRITEKDLAHPEISPIGVPISDLEIRLVDESGTPVAEGTPGEIWISGPGLARGYLNKPNETEAAFTTPSASWSGGKRWYRSGDIAVRLANGELAIIGRRDEQLKVRGHRIEPAEVEQAMNAHPEVAAAAVAKQELKGHQRLVGFVVPCHGEDEDQADRLKKSLTRHMSAELPDYMRPSEYVLLPELPLTNNGKLDRSALTHLAPSATDRADQFNQSRCAIRFVRTACEEMLDLPEVAADDNLFDLGMDSLAIVTLFVSIKEKFGVDLEPYMLPSLTAGAIAEFVEAEETQAKSEL